MSFSLLDMPPMASSRASLVFSLCTNTLYDDMISPKLDLDFHNQTTHQRHSTITTCSTRRARPRSLSLISQPTASFFTANDDGASEWFDETPRRDTFPTSVLSDEERVSIAPSEATSGWYEESLRPVSPFHCNDAMSYDTFGLPRWTSPRARAPSSSSTSSSTSTTSTSSFHDSQDSDSTSTGTTTPSASPSLSSSLSPAPSDTEDSASLRTLDAKLVLLDEQLLRSPIDSFEAMCWDATDAAHEKPPPALELELDWDPKLAEFRHSRLYGGDAHRYEQRQSLEADRLRRSELPRMRFDVPVPAAAPKASGRLLFSSPPASPASSPYSPTPASSRLAGMEYLLLATTPQQQQKFLPYLAPVSRKAAKVLDLPCDMSVIPALLDMPSSMAFGDYRDAAAPNCQQRQQRVGTPTSLPRNIADKWRRAVKSLRSPV